MQQHASTYSVTKTLIHPQPLGGVKGLYNFFFEVESSHIAYQIRREWSIEQHHVSTYSVL